MKELTEKTKTRKEYLEPGQRLIPTDFERVFLASNTEPIIDDGEEHGWD
jgi:hypothetical protein